MNPLLVCFIALFGTLAYVQAECPSLESMFAIGMDCKMKHKELGCIAQCFLQEMELTTPDGQLDKPKLEKFAKACEKIAAEHGVDLPTIKTCILSKPVDTSLPDCGGYAFMVACVSPQK